jgi:hypothetical protein
MDPPGGIVDNLMSGWLLRRVALWAYVTMSTASACSSNPVCEATPVTWSSPLTNGNAAASYLRLDAWEENAVVAIRVVVEDGQPIVCTGTLVSRRYVLTAAHCLGGSATVPFEVVFRIDTGARILRGGLWSTHPTLDLALVELESEVPAEWPVGTIPPASESGGLISPGTVLQIAGYGIDEHGSNGERKFMVASIWSVEDERFQSGAGGYGGACAGDSGGPALLRGPDGEVWLVGVLEEGESSCFGVDTFVRVDAAREWLDEAGVLGRRMIPPTSSHNALGSEGRCFGSYAVWTRDGSIHADDCSNGRTCGWANFQNGFRCIDLQEQRCGGIGELGECRGGDVVRCSRGVLEHIPCSACMWTCGRSPKTGMAACL